MLASVMPGLRELRAPLAAGYLWLLLVWMIWGDDVPTEKDVQGDVLERVYSLEPIISDLGRAVVASVAAYLVGSIVIAAQIRIGQPFGNWTVNWSPARGPVGVHRDRETARKFRSSAHLDMTRAGEEMLKSILPLSVPDEERAGTFKLARSHLFESREVIKTRLLDLSPALHSEVDRPDAEATFRMALCPPLIALGLTLWSSDRAWAAALLLLSLPLAWQWITLRKQANDALAAAIAARKELTEVVLDAVAQREASRAAA